MQPRSVYPGLCADCRWARAIRSGKGSTFWQCRRHFSDASYPRYPRLPVLACRGYEKEMASPATHG